jgi:hypothetical protein
VTLLGCRVDEVEFLVSPIKIVIADRGAEFHEGIHNLLGVGIARTPRRDAADK